MAMGKTNVNPAQAAIEHAVKQLWAKNVTKRETLGIAKGVGMAVQLAVFCATKKVGSFEVNAVKIGSYTGSVKFMLRKEKRLKKG
jgi:hypothetical protein